VLGMILLLPLVLVGVAKLSRRLPLVGRYAVRDAARHRTRTVPAVAAVAATVAGVVALGIGNASDAAESKATYSPRLAMGMGTLTVSEPDFDWARLEALMQRESPSVHFTAVTSYDAFRQDRFVDLRVRRPGVKGYDNLLDAVGSDFGMALVGEAALAMVLPADDDDLDDARGMLEQGGLVVLTSRPVDVDRVEVGGSVGSADGSPPQRLDRVVLPAYYLQVQLPAPAMVISPPGGLDELGLTAEEAGYVLDARELTKAEEDDLRELVQGVSDNAYVYVERGYQEENETLILLGILFVLGGVLMLGGTLTATFLALSDARPDLATLSAVGAAPRTRRGVAASFALVVGGVGAVVGAAVGFIPGIAISYPLTTQYGACTFSGSGMTTCEEVPGPSHYLDIPWPFIIGLVIVLPLLTALIVGLTARSRLPLVARLH
jgi:putative ABC transport system permease protein